MITSCALRSTETAAWGVLGAAFGAAVIHVHYAFAPSEPEITLTFVGFLLFIALLFFLDLFVSHDRNEIIIDPETDMVTFRGFRVRMASGRVMKVESETIHRSMIVVWLR